MSDGNTSFLQRMEALQQAYLQQLPRRVRQIEELWGAACEGNCSQRELNLLFQLVHQLHGSGSTFGLVEVTASTHRLEEVVRSFLVHGHVPGQDEQRQVLVDLSTLKRIAVEAPLGLPEVPRSDLRPATHPEISFVEEDASLSKKPLSPTILVVDDEVFIRKRIMLLLQFAGFIVVEADNGLTAVKRAQDRQPDLILMDVMMPVMDGLEATRRIHAQRSLRDVPVIILTLQNTIETVTRAASYNISDYIVKPFKRNQLIKRVKACLPSA